MMLGGLPAPYGNAAPGASLDYVPSMSMPYAHGTELGGMHGMNPAAFFPHAANLPPTPHWSQPVRPRHEPPALTPAALGDGVQPTPGAPHMADARAGAGAGAADEYPFPSVLAPADTAPSHGASASDGATPTGATPTHAPPAPGVGELSDALAALDVGARAPTPRGA